ncbi:trypsin [Thecamonas trahens ATCC 50062]|uniref:Trypsin n=1 Tax=Thecamonas trahens ATCC 50062 TaxID=461836 RepID=A0A0L0DHR9_THETB|nr:trypsin [Thecamonas trahens ATCC 50062]KNC51770.1 trypsin [Thecamonas trahens ATCC 50062]|eukprot:XP_013755643.1 trypsin [Thecamonas trahens ATCC 50062]
MAVVAVVVVVAAAVVAGSGGVAAEAPRIVGGSEASPGQFPDLVGIVDGLHFDVMCGGTLLSARWVLTAAHCVYDRRNTPSQLYVWPGGHDQTTADTSELVQADLVHVHASYNDYTAEHDDVALIRLSTPVDLGRADVRLARLASADPPDYAVATLAGWGATNTGGDVWPTVLKTIDTLIQRNGDCASNYASDGVAILSSHICAGEQCVSSRDSCTGDSGGPVYVKAVDGGLVQVGITSFGGSSWQPCGHPVFWAVNTRVSSYVPWMVARMEGDKPVLIDSSTAYSTTFGGGSAACSSGTPVTQSSAGSTGGTTAGTTGGTATTTATTGGNATTATASGTGGTSAGTGASTGGTATGGTASGTGGSGSVLSGNVSGKLTDGALQVVGGANVVGNASASGSLVVTADGVLTVGASSSLVVNGSVLVAASGELVLTSGAGFVAGSLTLTTGSRFKVVVTSALASGAPVRVAGSVEFAGALFLIEDRSHPLTAGQTFPIMTYGEHAGTFGEVFVLRAGARRLRIRAVRVLAATVSYGVQAATVEISEQEVGALPPAKRGQTSSTILFVVAVLCLVVIGVLVAAAFVAKRRSDARHRRFASAALPLAVVDMPPIAVAKREESGNSSATDMATDDGIELEAQPAGSINVPAAKDDAVAEWGTCSMAAPTLEPADLGSAEADVTSVASSSYYYSYYASSSSDE